MASLVLENCDPVLFPFGIPSFTSKSQVRIIAPRSFQVQQEPNMTTTALIWIKA
jgi:hypothetical protein